ncbi:hypothetical protein D3C77_525050 [compost metagenome]
MPSPGSGLHPSGALPPIDAGDPAPHGCSPRQTTPDCPGAASIPRNTTSLHADLPLAHANWFECANSLCWRGWPVHIASSCLTNALTRSGEQSSANPGCGYWPARRSLSPPRADPHPPGRGRSSSCVAGYGSANPVATALPR